MVKIPQYFSQTSTQLIRGGRAATAADFGGDGGLVALSQGISKASNDLTNIAIQKQDREATAYTTKESSSLQLKYLQRLEDLKRQEDSDNIIETLRSEYEEDLARVIQSAPNQRAQLAMQQTGSTLGNSLFTKAATFQSQQKYLKYKQSTVDTISSITNAVTVDPDGYDTYRKQIDNAISVSGQYLTPVEQEEYKQNAYASLAEAKISAEISRNPDQAIALLESEDYKNDLPSDSFSNLYKSAQKAKESNSLNQIKNQNGLLEELEQDNLSYGEKIFQINKMELVGDISQGFASDARRYLESKKNLQSATNSDAMADIITQMYDLNTIADQNEQDYLVGLQNLKRKIMASRVEGLLSREDEEKLNNQLRTLTAAKTADVTSTIGFSFGEANKIIEESLPPELRGKATRDLFYKVNEEIEKRGTVSREEERSIYKDYARNIVDTMNANRRKNALDAVDKIRNPVVEGNQEIETFLQQNGFTMDDVKETAKKYGMTEQQVIDRIRNK